MVTAIKRMVQIIKKIYQIAFLNLAAMIKKEYLKHYSVIIAIVEFNLPFKSKKILENQELKKQLINQHNHKSIEKVAYFDLSIYWSWVENTPSSLTLYAY